MLLIRFLAVQIVAQVLVHGTHMRDLVILPPGSLAWSSFGCCSRLGMSIQIEDLFFCPYSVTLPFKQVDRLIFYKDRVRLYVSPLAWYLEKCPFSVCFGQWLFELLS